ncbi:MAG: metal ABC transporter permease [Desulfurococcaceae archaeon]
MRSKWLILIVLISVSVILSITCYHDPRRFFAYISMGIIFGITSVIVYYKRLEFMAAGITHAGFLSVVLGYLLEYYTGVNLYVYAVLMGLVIIYSAMMLIERGFDPGKASAVLVSSTSALSVLISYYVLTSIPVRFSVSSIVFGDPLLITSEEVILIISLALVLLIATPFFIYELISTSIDKVSASIAGVRVSLLNALAYTILGLSVIALLRVSGYIMEHVMVLLPSITAVYYADNLREHVVSTILVSIFACSAGFSLSLILGLSPTGTTGLVLITMFIIGYLLRSPR